MENSFLKRFHGRCISMDTPELLEFSVPVNKAIKPDQLYDGINGSQINYQKEIKQKPLTTKLSSKSDTGNLPKIKVRSFSPYPSSNVSETHHGNKKRLISLNKKFQFIKLISQQNTAINSGLKKRMTNLNNSFNLNLEFSPIDLKKKSKNKTQPYALSLVETPLPGDIASPIRDSYLANMASVEYGFSSERESSPVHLIHLNGYARANNHYFSPEDLKRTEEKKRRVSNLLKVSY